MQKTSRQHLYDHVRYLTEVRPFRNFQNLQSLAKVKDYLAACLATHGFITTEQRWMAEGEEYTNILATYQPDKPKRLIVGAHYDVCGDQPGADDNASAVAGLLETARLIAENQPPLDYGIDLAFYCLEEPPFFATEFMGSFVHAQSLKNADANVLGMVCYEMIGYFSDEPGSQPFPDPALASMYPDTANFIIVVGIQAFGEFMDQFHSVMSQEVAIDVQKICFPDSSHLAGLSDHRNYWHFGFPAVMINDTSFIRNPHYHEITDTIDTLDFDKMTAVVDAAYRGIVGLTR